MGSIEHEGLRSTGHRRVPRMDERASPTSLREVSQLLGRVHSRDGRCSAEFEHTRPCSEQFEYVGMSFQRRLGSLQTEAWTLQAQLLMRIHQRHCSCQDVEMYLYSNGFLKPKQVWRTALACSSQAV